MKSTTTGAVSGCIVWVILFTFISACLLPLTFIVGGFTSESNFAAGVEGSIICPKGTIGQIYSFDTTTTDSSGVQTPANGYELHCVDANGKIIKNDPIVFGFLWEGIAAGASLILTAVLSLLFAAPAGS